MWSIKPYENSPLIAVPHPLKASRVSLSDNAECLETYECDLNRISREKKKNEQGEKKQEEAKGQRTCKNPRGVELTYIFICINHLRVHFHGVGLS